MNKYILGLSVALALVVGLLIGGYKSGNLGGVSYDKTDLATLNVSGDTNLHTTTVTGALAVTGGVTGFATSSLSTLNVSGTATTSLLAVTSNANILKYVAVTSTITNFFVNNGTNCTKISFAANSTTPSYTTSTCP